jgi:hypothetical protein
MMNPDFALKVLAPLAGNAIGTSEATISNLLCTRIPLMPCVEGS